MVITHTPWPAASDLVSIRWSLAAAAVTEAMRFAVWTVFFGLRWRWSLVFFQLCLPNNFVNLWITQAPVPVGSYHCFYFCKALTSFDEISDKVLRHLFLIQAATFLVYQHNMETEAVAIYQDIHIVCIHTLYNWKILTGNVIARTARIKRNLQSWIGNKKSLALLILAETLNMPKKCQMRNCPFTLLNSRCQI
jgi:hypothetical protein